ncbi:MAG: hypothetical protein GC160_13205 [Acidobacteria bacterium]|nr:hypothetical protein [Acidobacteriota bacterium]
MSTEQNSPEHNALTQAVDYLVAALMILFTIVALGLMTSIEMALIFSGVLGVLLATAAAAPWLLRRGGEQAVNPPAEAK